MEAMNPELIRAISEKRLIQFVYKGGETRIAEPHDYGIRSGAEKLLAYQISGESRSGNAHGWKELGVADISQLRVLDTTFPGSRGDSTKKHLDWLKVFVRVK